MHSTANSSSWHNGQWSVIGAAPDFSYFLSDFASKNKRQILGGDVRHFYEENPALVEVKVTAVALTSTN
jgi:hypothetical protein